MRVDDLSWKNILPSDFWFYCNFVMSICYAYCIEVVCGFLVVGTGCDFPLVVYLAHVNDFSLEFDMLHEIEFNSIRIEPS